MKTCRLKAARRSALGDAGFTVVELTVTMGLTAIVMAALLGIVVSQSKAERRVSTFSDNQEVVRQAMVALQRDIRSAESLKPLTAPLTSSDYALRIDLDLFTSTDGAATPMRWLVDSGTGELRREEVDGLGNATSVTYRLRGITNSDSAPLFTFLKVDGTPYDTEYPIVDPTEDIAKCSVRIRIDLRALPNVGPAPTRMSSDAVLRNRVATGTGCTTSTP